MKKHGLSEKFPAAVAHGIHSIALENIQHYFKPDATEDNRVPPLNYDATSKQSLLRNPPLYCYHKSFNTTGMQRADKILTNMDKKIWYLKHCSTLEKFVHVLRMDEIWAQTKPHYDHLKEEGTTWMTEKALYERVNDIDNNDIFKLLHFMNLKIRYQGLTSKKLAKMKDGHYVDWSDRVYRYKFFIDLSPELLNFNFTLDVKDNLQRAY